MDFSNIKNIKSPADIKAMSMADLHKVADQMRDAVLLRTSLFSGHVGPSLGDIEEIWPDYPSKDDFFFNEDSNFSQLMYARSRATISS